MRLLVLGGTAWLGSRVATTALERGHNVTCLARGDSGSAPTGSTFISSGNVYANHGTPGDDEGAAAAGAQG